MSNIFINYFLGGNMKINFTRLVMLVVTIQVTILSVISQLLGWQKWLLTKGDKWLTKVNEKLYCSIYYLRFIVFVLTLTFS